MSDKVSEQAALEPILGACQSSGSSGFGHSGGVLHEEREDCIDWVKAQAVAPEPKYCEIHQHYKPCEHNGGVRRNSGWEWPVAPASHPGEAPAYDPEGVNADIRRQLRGAELAAKHSKEPK